MTPSPGWTRRRRAALALVIAVPTALHVLLAVSLPLAPDETYYWEWSRRLAWGYYDQGPMIAWWIRAGTSLFGETPFGVRAGVVAAALLTRWFVFLLARDLYGARVGLWAAALSAVVPLAVVGGFVATYDPLLALFWASGCWFAARLFLMDRRTAWVGLGLSFGAGLLSKHTMVLLAPSVLIFLATAPAQRTWLRRWEPYAALGLGVLCFVPNLVWQSHHGWMTFAHLAHLSGKGVDNSLLRRAGDFLGSQIGLLTPVLFAAFVVALWWAAQRRREPDGESGWFAFSVSAPVLAAFVLMTAKAKVQANWAVCGWVTPPVVYAAWLHRAPLGGSRHAWGWLWAGVGSAAGLSAALAWVGVMAEQPFRPPFNADRQVNKMYGGTELARVVAGELESLRSPDGTAPVVGAATYDTASRLAFYLPGRPRTRCFFLGTRANSYLLWNHEAGLEPGGNALIVDDRTPDDPLLPPYAAIFESVEPVREPVRVWRRPAHSEPVHAYYLYRCRGYRPNPPAEVTVGG